MERLAKAEQKNNEAEEKRLEEHRRAMQTTFRLKGIETEAGGPRFLFGT